ncbi:MAG: hypothetical protein ACI9WC_003522 [Arenicella sp.]|jgi:hypothetical protein
MGNRSEYWCKRRVRLTSISTGQFFATCFFAFRFAPLLHKTTSQKIAGYMGVIASY